MRRGHWLRPNHRTTIPPVHFCLATSSRPVKEGFAERELHGAALVELTWTAGRAEMGVPLVINDARLIWHYLEHHLPAKGTAWIWCLDPDQDIPLLGFTDLVERKVFVRDWWVWSQNVVLASGKLAGKKVKIQGVANWLDTIMGELDAIYPPFAACWPDDSAACDADGGQARSEVTRCAYFVGEVLSFVHREDLGNLRNTVGGQALQSYRHLHLQHPIDIHANKQALTLERSAALGFPVRCPVRGHYNAPLYVVDVNALYPWVMRNYPYPCKLHSYSETDDVPRLKELAANYLLVARVSGEDAQREYLVKRDNKCVWDYRLERDVLCGPDLDSALTRGTITHVHETAVYSGALLFEQWGQWAWDLRQRYKQRADAVGDAIAKALSVALWGRFAARSERWEAYDQCPAPMTRYGYFVHHPVDGPPAVCRAIAGVVDMLKDKTEPGDSAPAIAAFVACYARTFMDGIIALAGRDNLVYQVADALHVTEAGYEKLSAAGLVVAGQFGALKQVRRVEEAYYHGPNTFQHDGAWTQAGRLADADQVGEHEWAWESVESISSSIVQPPRGTVNVVPHRVTLSSELV